MSLYHLPLGRFFSPKFTLDLRRKKWSITDCFLVWKVSSRHSNKLGMFLLYVSNLKLDETRSLGRLVLGPLVYQLRSLFPSLGIWASMAAGARVYTR